VPAGVPVAGVPAAGAPAGGCVPTGAPVAGVEAGADFVTGLFRSNTDDPAPAFFVDKIASVNDVSMNKPAAIVVAFESTVAAPRGPNAVCDPMPPNAPARSAALPLCNKTTTTRKTHTSTWMMVNKIVMSGLLSSQYRVGWSGAATFAVQPR
jgi:hypothetical protein